MINTMIPAVKKPKVYIPAKYESDIAQAIEDCAADYAEAIGLKRVNRTAVMEKALEQSPVLIPYLKKIRSNQ